MKPYETIDPGVARRYRKDQRIGRGCYGVVWEVRDVAAPQARSLALKKVLHAFRDSTDAQRTYREVSYLLAFGDHANILKVHEVLCSLDDRHVYMVSELMDSDLQKALRCSSLQPVHRPLVVYQVARALKYIHSAGVMHRDVKPANVLLDSSCQVALADFGWARRAPASVGDDGLMTEYASARWYRSPEQLLGGRQYTTSVDLWALACVAGEVHGAGPLLPGTSTIDMIERILEVVGKPLPMDVAAMNACYADLSFDVLPSAPPHNPIHLLFREERPEFVDFMSLLLQWNPDKRLTAAEVLVHPYVGAFHDPDNEPSFGRQVFLALPDTEKLPASEYRDQVYADAVGLEQSKRIVERRSHERRRQATLAGDHHV